MDLAGNLNLFIGRSLLAGNLNLFVFWSPLNLAGNFNIYIYTNSIWREIWFFCYLWNWREIWICSVFYIFLIFSDEPTNILKSLEAKEELKEYKKMFKIRKQNKEEWKRFKKNYKAQLLRETSILRENSLLRETSLISTDPNEYDIYNLKLRHFTLTENLIFL